MIQKKTSTSNKKKAPIAKLFPVVCVGASAGGLEAFKQLLNKLSKKTGMAFVLIQHLSPTYESILDELLSRETKIPVTTAKNNMPLEPDHIYIIPPNIDMGILNMKLKLYPAKKVKGCQMPIDFFLRSLAKDQGSNGIGIILSGTASDGVNGIKELKAAGGITFAQDEKTAQYLGMPLNAIDSGCIDMVLPPEKIANEINRISKHPYIHPSGILNTEKLPSEHGGELKKIFFFLRRDTGIDFTYYKQTTINRRIKRRMVLLKLKTIVDYLSYLQKNPTEIKSLYEDILINVTVFFRDPATIETLKKEVFPKILKNKKSDQTIRIWVPGCSTGEEAYSIAISLIEFLDEIENKPAIQIFATDISENSIDKARAGIYSENSVSEISPQRLRRFFVNEGNNRYKINTSIREICVFAKQDITTDPPFSNIDFISCRNVLIYLGSKLQKRVLQFFHYALKPTGFLMLGTSESISSNLDLFDVIDKKNNLFSKKLVTRPAKYAFTAPRNQISLQNKSFKFNKVYYSEFDIQQEANNILLSKYVPASILINSNMEILNFWGNTSLYLEHPSGKANLNLMKMVREDLFISLKTAISKAEKEKINVIEKEIRLKRNNKILSINIEVKPIIIPDTEEQCLLILFKENIILVNIENEIKGISEEKPVELTDKSKNNQILILQQELEQMRVYLQSATEDAEAMNEELRASNEELMSSNEELQSTNEELETAKEELQSTNEEIATVNEELSNRNVALDRTNNDLVNLLSSVNIPILILGNDLCIRRFNNMAEKAFNLIPSDIGRKFTNIKPNIKIHDFENFIMSVMDTLTVKEREVQDNDGKWYSIRIRPYRTTKNKIDGVVITLLDIDELKRNLEKAEQALSYSENIVNTIREPLLVLDDKLKILSASNSFYSFFCLKPKEVESKLIYELSNGKWDIPLLKQSLEEILPKKNKFDNLEISNTFHNIGFKTLFLNARRIENNNYGSQKILLAIEDVTERNKASQKIADYTKALEKVNLELENFTSAASHDLRSPLIAIISYTDLLMENYSDKIDKEGYLYFEKINQCAKRLNVLISDLIKLCDITQIMNPYKEVHINQILDKVESMLEFDIINSNIDLKINKDMPVILCDKIKITAVFQNLIQNAIKFVCKTEGIKPKVEIGYADKNAFYEFYIKDNGIGIDSIYHKKIFNAFERLHSLKDYDGTGMGLHFVKRIVEEHGGNVWVESKLDQGSTFYFTIKKNIVPPCPVPTKK